MSQCMTKCVILLSSHITLDSCINLIFTECVIVALFLYRLNHLNCLYAVSCFFELYYIQIFSFQNTVFIEMFHVLCHSYSFVNLFLWISFPWIEFSFILMVYCCCCRMSIACGQRFFFFVSNCFCFLG